MIKKCGYCKGTGRRIQKTKKAEGLIKVGRLIIGGQCEVNERCRHCNGTGIKNK